MPAPYPEPEGYSTMMGFVKSNPLNNDYYVEQWKDDPWYFAIKTCHDRLTQIIPGYNISQIKEKFGGLRFYIDFPEGVTDFQKNNALATTTWAENFCDGVNWALQNLKGK